MSRARGGEHVGILRRRRGRAGGPASAGEAAHCFLGSCKGKIGSALTQGAPGFRPRLLGLTVVAFVSLLLSAEVARAGCAPDAVELRTPDGATVRFAVELADTPAERSRGLMFRESLPASSGMLFLFAAPHSASFWMKNTRIPLDILFAGQDGRVTRVHPMAVPGDETPIPGGPGVQSVLEINGGLAARLGLVAGSVMRHPALDQARAVWPCD